MASVMLNKHLKQNVFWDLHNSDPHHALSFDWLHSNNSSLFGHHLLEQFKALITRYGCSQQQQIDTQFNTVPHWSGLVHFQEVMKVTFTDSSKYEDLSRLVAYVVHNVIPSHNKTGWLLLCCLQSFAIVDLILTFEAYTEHMIKSGWCELANFAKCMKKYIDISTSESMLHGDAVKNWNFPKMHVLVHSFNDIEQKGASCNYNTKLNEKLHGPLKKSYLMRTNFKNVGPQVWFIDYRYYMIFKVEHLKFVFSLIHSQINETEHQKNVDEDMDDPPELSSLLLDSDVIEAPWSQPMTSFTSMGDSFRTSLVSWLTKELPAHDIVVPSPIEFCLDDWITQYQSLRIIYESKVNFQQYINLTTNGCIFAQLLHMFSIYIADRLYPICWVQPLDALISKSVKDYFERAGDYLIMDVIDHTGDLFLHCNKIFDI
ncbi:hypothetical protein BJV74DRAFT_798764 [Russula compacta]|nr:hypothetical protein BJV74DRAFT_798764 [Russula compacta]